MDQMILERVPTTETFRDHALFAVSMGLQRLQECEYATDENIRLARLDEIFWQMYLYRASLIQGLSMNHERKQWGQWEYKKPEKDNG
jgi:hypothetical protein